jgi:hypothetical protein
MKHLKSTFADLLALTAAASDAFAVGRPPAPIGGGVPAPPTGSGLPPPPQLINHVGGNKGAVQT